MFIVDIKQKFLGKNSVMDRSTTEKIMYDKIKYNFCIYK